MVNEGSHEAEDTYLALYEMAATKAEYFQQLDTRNFCQSWRCSVVCFLLPDRGLASIAANTLGLT